MESGADFIRQGTNRRSVARLTFSERSEKPPMKVQFIGTIGIIVRDRSLGRRFYASALRLPLVRAKGADFLFTRRLPGSRYFGVWPLSAAARECFGVERWPKGRPVPQAFLEFEVASAGRVTTAGRELSAKGYAPVHPPRTDAWGQTVARWQTDDGLLIAISHVPWMHRRPRRRRR